MAAERTERKNPFLPIIFLHFLSFRFSRAKQSETQSSKSKRPPLSFLSSIRRRKHKNKSIKLLEGGVNSREKKRESPPSLLSSSLSPPMENDLSEHQIQSMKEAFTLFDTDRDGKISPSDLGVLMRSLGSNPTQAQLRSIVLEEGLKEPFDFTRFVDLMSKYLRPEPFEQQLCEAFKVIDKEGSGFVAVAELRHILTSIGEKLEPGEFDEWIREVHVGSDGRIRIEDFIARMVAK